jgi:hypothetical protein
MKVAVTQECRAPAEPPIPLDRPVKRELEKGDYLVYKLRNDPADPTSGGYDLTIRISGMALPNNSSGSERTYRRCSPDRTSTMDQECSQLGVD